MTKLLVSVRNVTEAILAANAGADLIDIKEPARGGLGAADPTVVRSIVRALNQKLPISVALGDLKDIRDTRPFLASQSIRFAKVGLAQAPPDWRKIWQRLMSSFPARTQRVAVAYADYPRAGAPAPLDILEVGHALGCTALLIDTYRKDGTRLLDHVEPHELQHLISVARQAEMLTVVAGALDASTVRAVLPLGPDYVGVRGAVCPAGREGNLDPQRVTRLVSLLRRSARPASAAAATA